MTRLNEKRVCQNCAKDILWDGEDWWHSVDGSVCCYPDTRAELFAFPLKVRWDKWIGWSGGGPVVMWTRNLISFRGWNVDLHLMVNADMPKAYHTHPARAIRLILWGGYAEELEDGFLRLWRPGMVGYVAPELSHRVDALLKGRSLSLWIRAPLTAPIKLRGSGWDATGVPHE